MCICKKGCEDNEEIEPKEREGERARARTCASERARRTKGKHSKRLIVRKTQVLVNCRKRLDIYTDIYNHIFTYIFISIYLIDRGRVNTIYIRWIEEG